MNPIAPASDPPSDTVRAVLKAAHTLWHAGNYAQARQAIDDALTQWPHAPALQSAARAYDAVFGSALQGRHLALERRSPLDLQLVRSAWSDRAFMDRFHRFAPPLPAEDAALAQVLERESRATLLDARNLHWSIVAQDGRRCGMASLTEISMRHARCEFIVGVLDAAPGIALEASLLLLEFAFCVLRMHKVCSTVYGSNDYALQSTLHLGFRQEGVQRDQLRDTATGEFVSLCLSGLFAQQFFCEANQRLARRLLGRPLRVPA